MSNWNSDDRAAAIAGVAILVVIAPFVVTLTLLGMTLAMRAASELRQEFRPSAARAEK
jgi:hypothetical protein